MFLNAIVRSKGDKQTYYGHEIPHCRDRSTLHSRLPFEKGYVVDWDAQKAIWDGMFLQFLKADISESSLLITEPYFNLPQIQRIYDQFVFEEYGFQSYYRSTPASLIPHGSLFTAPHKVPNGDAPPPPDCMLVVDSGFSFTHVVPLISGSIVWNAVKRIDVGGKLLTNHLKELVSYRQWNMMDQTYIMDDVKEKCCYVSPTFRADMELSRVERSKNPLTLRYLLPDFSLNRPGNVLKPGEVIKDASWQVLEMNSERFTIPELLFTPSDIGLEQIGLAQAIAHSISLLPEELHGMFWGNVGLIGGNTKFPGFVPRLMNELRSLASVDYEIAIYQSPDPVTEAYRSAHQFVVSSPSVYAQRYAITREDYFEVGSDITRRRWRGPYSDVQLRAEGRFKE